MIKILEPNAREEYDALLAEVCDGAVSTSERVRLMVRLMHDAKQSHRDWAHAVDDGSLRDGYANEIKRYLKRTRVVVLMDDGRSVSKPATVGAKRVDEKTGKWFDAQLPLEVLTFDELRGKRIEYVTQANAYTDNIATADKLLALEYMAPGARTPDEAARKIGTTVAVYLAAAA